MFVDKCIFSIDIYTGTDKPDDMS